MKTLLGRLLVAGLGLFALTGGAQPVITNQPAGQMVVVGGNATFSVLATGPGPFTYQWQLNGTNLPNNIITTVAGGGSSNPGDGGSAGNAGLNVVTGIAADNLGNYYIADYGYSRIQKVDTNGIITTVAGNGTYGYSGDNGAATNASLYSPNCVAVDALGNVFFSEYSDSRIRKVDTNGIITTVAGNGTAGYSGDNGAATNANLNYPYGIVLDTNGNLFIADYENNRVRRVDTNGIITTVAGNGDFNFSGDGGYATNATFRYPDAVMLDSSNNLYVADHNNMRIRRVDANGIITTVVGNGNPTYPGDGGSATNAGLYYPAGMVMDSFGYLFIAEQGNSHIRQVDPNGIITTVAGNGNSTYSGDGGSATNAGLNYPAGVATTTMSGGVLIADEWNFRIRNITLGRSPFLQLNQVATTNAGNYAVIVTNAYGSVTSSIVTLTTVSFQISNQTAYASSNVSFGVTAVGPGPVAYQWQFNGANMAWATNALLALTNVQPINQGVYDIVVSNNAGTVTSSNVTLIVTGFPPSSVVIAPTNQMIAVGANLNLAVTAQGSLPFGYGWQCNSTNIPGATNSTFTLASAARNNSGSYRVVVTNAFGSVTSTIANVTVGIPPVITVQPQSAIVTNGGSASFTVVASGVTSLNYQWYFNTNTIGGGTNAVLPVVSVDSSKTGSYFCVITDDNGSITSRLASLTIGLAPVITLQPVTQTNINGTTVIFTTAVSGTGPFTYQWQFNGTNLPNNIITTVAGNGTNGFSGDGGPATNAGLASPLGVAFDANGNLFIADYGDNHIRKVDTNGIITTVATNGVNNGVTVDAVGNLFIAIALAPGQPNNFIRKVATNGVKTTVASALFDPIGLACDSDGNLFIGDFGDEYVGHSHVFKLNTSGTITNYAGNGTYAYSGDGGAATNAGLSVTRLTFDSVGNLFLADLFNHRVRKVDTKGIITTVAGNGTNGFSGDGGAATNASMISPTGVAVDDKGDLFIADEGAYRIRMVDTNGIITTVAGKGINVFSGDGGPATNAGVHAAGIIMHAGNLFIGDWNNSVREVHFAGMPTLALNNVSFTNAGNYSVIITSTSGSVTSSVASLTVVLPGYNHVAGQLLGDGTMQLSFVGISGGNYALESTVSLSPANWIPQATNTADALGNLIFTNAPDPATNDFWRIRSVP